MLVSMKRLLDFAEANKIAIGAFNVVNLEGIRAALSAAEELHQPVIIQFAEAHDAMIPIDILGPIMVMMAEKATVPVCVHLDHGENLAFVKKALDIGFTSVMYDGSTLDFEKNVANTCMAVVIASAYKASVEAEIGSIGRESFGNANAEEDIIENVYTNPIEAKEFVERTRIDALACSFGTVHGLYMKKPKLNLGLISEIRKETNIPIVMHGGSGICESEYKECIKCGVRKINYYTYAAKAGGKAVKEMCNTNNSILYFHDIANCGMDAIKSDVMSSIKTFSNL